LSEIVKSITQPLQENKNIEIVWEELQPAKPYPFPWPFFKFLDVFPESVWMDAPEMRPFSFDPKTRFDLVLLAYQVWYLGPSLPVAGFLKSPEARIMKDRPVITVVNCRDKWLMAQERVKECLKRVGGKLIDNVALVHQGNAITSLITTLRWLWTGKKEGFWKIFPSAGVSDKDIKRAERFGKAIEHALETGEIEKSQPLFRGLGAVRVDPNIIKQEKAAYGNFLVWGKIMKAVGKQGELKRLPFLVLFMLYLSMLILISFPVSLILHIIINPLRKKALLKELRYYEEPSGSSTEKLNPG
jgi:hypothetical protein